MSSRVGRIYTKHPGLPGGGCPTHELLTAKQAGGSWNAPDCLKSRETTLPEAAGEDRGHGKHYIYTHGG